MYIDGVTARGSVVRYRDYPDGNYGYLDLVHVERVRDEDGQWQDGEKSYFTAAVRGKLTERAAKLEPGDALIVTGTLSFANRTLENGSTVLHTVLQAKSFGFDALLYPEGAPARVTVGPKQDRSRNIESNPTQGPPSSGLPGQSAAPRM